jgi:hypothetical protein
MAMKHSAMTWFASAWAALLFGSVPLTAQYSMPAQKSFGTVGAASSSLIRPGPPGASPVVVPTPPPQALGCPVSLRAQHKADGTMVRTGNAHPQGSRGIGQWLHLTLTDPEGNKAASAQMTVHGFSDTPRVTQTSGNPSDARRTMTVPFTATGAAAEADVWIPGMTAVTTVDVHAVTFEDGSVRDFAANAGCSIAPDPFMRVAGN